MNRRTKKLFSLLLSLALVAGMIPAFGMTANAEEKPTMILKVTWNSDYSITFQTNHSAEGRSNYGFGIIGEEDGIRHVSTWLGSGELVCDGNTATLPAEEVKKLLAHLDESGRYYAGVWFGDEPEDTYVASASKLILVNRLPAPGNLHWDGPVAKWDPVDGARGYYVWVYADGHYLRSFDTKETELDLSSYMSVPPAHTYRFDIQTLGPSFDKADSEIIKGPEKLFETMPDDDGAEIADRVLVNVEEPVDGAKPASTIWCAGAELKTINWYQETTTERGIQDWTAMPAASSFREGRKYMAEILLTPESGYVFAPKSDLNLTLTNNNYLTGGIVSLSESELLLRVQFEASAVQKNPFVDVSESDYFYEPVLWAVDKGITNGTDATHFSPDATCTRGQVVTFLWRAAGSPTPASTTNPFTDVASSDYYYNAVLWAVGKNITNGTSATTFGPNDGCTRGQVVTFLHRFENSPSPSSTANPFVDVSSSEYYYDPVLWAVGKGITNGTDAAHFSPNATCTRGQIVTFLYRDMK